jgi:para-nitrobenzyl esterase
MSQAIVNTKSGKLEGYAVDGLFVFKGIPYAAPPVGNLRWMPPQPVKPWSGVRPAKEYGAISPQNTMPGGGAPGTPDFGNQPQSEDCLLLNVWTPGLDDARRPVFFWIHGGAFIMGSGTEAFLEEGILARRGDVVIVSINYRLGAFGFMNLKEITRGRIPATGNEGLLDQVAALDWVQDNIAAFGGNPDNVTISGFSAGGMSVGTLLSMPGARGKFHKAMNRSGAANKVEPLDNAIKLSEKYLRLLNLNGKDTDALRDLSVQRLLDAQQQLGTMVREAIHRTTPFEPVADGKILTEMPITAIRKGFSKNIPMMAGNTIDEMKAMNKMDPSIRNLDETGLVERLSKQMQPDAVPGLIKAYSTIMQQHGDAATPPEIAGSITTDLFLMPTIRMVEAQRDNGAPAYYYLFTHKSPAMGGALGAMHGLDNPFLFGALDAQFTGNDPEEENLAVKIQDSCIAFIRTGDPSCKSIGKWPVYGKKRMTMILDKSTRVEAAPYEAERVAWDKVDLTYTPPV